MAQIFFTKSGRRPSAFATLGLVIMFLSAVTFTGALFILGFFQQTSPVPQELLDWRLKLLELANMLLLGGSAVTIAGLLHGRFSSRVRTSWRGFIAVILGLAVAAPMWAFERAKSNNASLHDVTTNLLDPPYFIYLAERSYDTSSQLALMGGRLEASYVDNHTAAYSDLQTIRLPLPAATTLQIAEEIAVRLGWHLEDKKSSPDQMEWSVVHPLFQLRSNIVVRVRSVDADKVSLLDVRAVSRLGVTDYGINASLIREFQREILSQANGSNSAGKQDTLK